MARPTRVALVAFVVCVAPACTDSRARPSHPDAGAASAEAAPARTIAPQEPHLELRLRALRARYELAEGGDRLRQQLADFRRAEVAQRAEVAREATVPERLRKRLAQPILSPPEALPVDLALEITNHGATTVDIRGDGDDRAEIDLDLRGPGVELVEPPRLWTLEMRVAEPISLEPGATHVLPISRLAYGPRGDAVRAYWTLAGTYTLGATLKTASRPPPARERPDDEGFGRAVLSSNDVTLTVASKRGAGHRRRRGSGR